MLLIPAIDIKNNNCVRLLKGKLNKNTIFKKNTIFVINKWFNFGIKRIHIVDLDGAFSGKPKNLLTIKSIIKNTKNSIDIQLGGGIRSIDTIKYYFDLGIKKIILGTKAIIDLDFFEHVCNEYKDNIIISLDIKGFKIAINGWKKYYNYNFFNFLKNIQSYNFESIIYTDIDRDGTLKGINFKKIEKILKYINKPIIISGGISKTKDIESIFSFQGSNLLGVIFGKSIYTGNINFEYLNNKFKLFNKIIIKNINEF